MFQAVHPATGALAGREGWLEKSGNAAFLVSIEAQEGAAVSADRALSYLCLNGGGSPLWRYKGTVKF
jgi:hypothetical protein